MKFTNRHHLTGMGFLILALSACSTTPPPPPHHTAAPAVPLADHGPGQLFETPEKAADALADANRRGDKNMLLQIMGQKGAKIVSSGDPVADKEGRDRFAAAYDVAHHFDNDGDNKKILVIGKEEWPVPIPIVHVVDKNQPAGSWQFDTAAGEQEILNRRIGHNEISAIKTSDIYVEAQREYAIKSAALPGKHAEFAQHFISTEDTHDGLYWPKKSGQQESPLGPLVAKAQAEGYDVKSTHDHPQPYHGYYYKILTSQGSHASDGARDYIIHGHMTGGFALLAFPAKWGDSGVMTFIVSQDGIVYEKNLGPQTAKQAAHITQYDPDDTWRIVDE